MAASQPTDEGLINTFINYVGIAFWAGSPAAKKERSLIHFSLFWFRLPDIKNWIFLSRPRNVDVGIRRYHNQWFVRSFHSRFLHFSELICVADGACRFPDFTSPVCGLSQVSVACSWWILRIQPLFLGCRSRRCLTRLLGKKLS
jgi:hypothetical protein